jgi:hypothetical protein
MQEEQPLDPPERELAEALGRLELDPLGSEQRQIWYRAGVEAGRRRVNRWRAVAAVALAAGVALASARGSRPAPVERIVYVRAPAAVPPPVAAGDQLAPSRDAAAYPRLRDAILREGLSGLPQVPGGGAASLDAVGPAGERLDPTRWYLNEEG